MQKLPFTPSSKGQCSSFILDNLQPIQMRKHWDTNLKANSYIKPFIRAIELITDLGELEHTSDWDLSIKLGYNNPDNPDQIEYMETEPGYYIMAIQGNKILLEDEAGIGDQQDEDISYHTIPISEIRSLQIIRH